MNVLSLNEIESEGIIRVSTGINSLDKILGVNQDNKASGMAKGSLIMLAGQAGAGKSRLAIEVATNLNKKGSSTLTFQLEATPSDYKAWTKNKVTNPSNFFVSDERNHVKQIEIIKHVKPEFVIVDSVNRYDCSYNEVASLIDDLQSCARETGTIILMIGQLDKKGNKMMVRGSQDWTFLPDVVLLVYKDINSEKEVIKDWMDKLKMRAVDIGVSVKSKHRVATEVKAKEYYKEYLKENEGVFVVDVPDKNRFGRTGGKCKMKHTSNGVEEFV